MQTACSHACGQAGSGKRLELRWLEPSKASPSTTSCGIKHLKHGALGDSLDSSHKYAIYVYIIYAYLIYTHIIYISHTHIYYTHACVCVI